jgi:pimeloyl-ACP methyl ester carboxylesterase
MASISIPVRVWHSRDDRFVPFGHGRWLVGAIPGAYAELEDDAGHLTVVASPSATCTRGSGNTCEAVVARRRVGKREANPPPAARTSHGSAARVGDI